MSRCKNGHELRGPQDYRPKEWGGGCMACHREAQLRYLAKNRDARRQMKELQAKLKELGIAV